MVDTLLLKYKEARGLVVCVRGVDTCDPGSTPSEGRLFSKMCSESSVSTFVLASVTPRHVCNMSHGGYFKMISVASIKNLFAAS